MYTTIGLRPMAFRPSEDVRISSRNLVPGPSLHSIFIVLLHSSSRGQLDLDVFPCNKT